MELAPSESIFEVILFLFPLELLCAKLLDYTEVELIGGAELPVGNRAFQEVLTYQGADDQGGVAVRASHCSCGDVGFEGCKSNFIILFLFGGCYGNSGHIYIISVQCIKRFIR